ncbi:type VI secretion lipoprotein TssJ [Photorhabdus luminescens]|uniref:type VI secretion lipoprotein TssJ n=1 Tax=Photorhabdus luminescens TaxID=29488 RepID=UPI00224050AC|nr:type VI secretion lipoprotein TssJ [Photorhabdus luminescens]MCW7762724.1 type VI secretion lipoprotein TssJ [Photorhabdus luminescens subsp. venezuelensis]
MNNMNFYNIIKRRFLILAVILLINGCSHSISNDEKRLQAIEQAKPVYASNAIRLKITAVPQLNVFNNMSNSCTILIVQAEKREQLDKLLANSALLRNLFAGTGATEQILQLDNYVMMPGQSVSLHIDRAEQARYIALIAGYYPAPDSTHTRVLSLPLRLEQHGWWNSSWNAEFIPMSINLTLGRYAITRSDFSAGNTGDEVVFPRQIVFPGQTAESGSDESLLRK